MQEEGLEQELGGGGSVDLFISLAAGTPLAGGLAAGGEKRRTSRVQGS